MKQVLLAAVLAALASSALTLLLAGAFRPAPPPAPAAISAADFKAALADVESRLSSIQAALGAGAGKAGSSDPGGAVPAPGFPAPVPAEEPIPVLARTAGTAEAPGAPAESIRRFDELLPRTSDGKRFKEGRQEKRIPWLFRGEKEVLDWFGTPYLVTIDGTSERWDYELPTGTVDEEGYPLTRDFWIRLNRGRLIDIGD